MGLFDKLLNTKQTNQKAGSPSPVSPEEIYESARLELQDIIAPAALKIESRAIKIGGYTAKSFFVISYPRFLVSGWMAPIINLDKRFDIAVHIHPIETEQVLRKFQKKVAEVQSQINIRAEKGMVRDPELYFLAFPAVLSCFFLENTSSYWNHCPT